jgi:ABC-type branched-subunit amino acid transport system ATPase component
MVFPGRTIRENVDHALAAARLTHGPSALVDPEQIIEYVQLDHLPTTLASDLSWGQSRLLGIGLALAIRPVLLMLDEPFAGLSLAAADQVGTILQHLKRDGISVCVIDHELRYLLPVCDVLVVLVAGAMLAEGEPSEVIARTDVKQAYLGV